MLEQEKWQYWRKAVAAWHPLPPLEACLLYLASEVGEACDAFLRQQRQADDRSHERPVNLGRELAQVVDMAYAVALRSGIDLDYECALWRQAVYARGQTDREEEPCEPDTTSAPAHNALQAELLRLYQAAGEPVPAFLLNAGWTPTFTAGSPAA